MLAPGTRTEPVTVISPWLRWAPLPLLAVSVALGVVTTPALIRPERLWWSLLPTLVILVIRVLAEALTTRLHRGSRGVIAGYVGHALVLLVGVALNPFLCIYAFFGYLDSDRFLGGRFLTPVAVVGTGLICAFGQSGGLPGVSASPPLFIALSAVNVTLAMMMLRVGQSREQEVAAREAAVESLARANAENADLHAQLVRQAHETGVAEERARLSRELHDTVAQGLVGVIRQLENLPADLSPSVRQRVDRAEATARDCLTDARRAVRALGPQQLRDADLVAAVRDVVENWSAAHDIAAQVVVDGNPVAGRGDDAVVRVVQEALSNIARHAGAAAVTVTLTWSTGELIVDVRDDGCGFDPDRVVRGHGLNGMAARLAELGGRLVVESRPGAGTTIVAVLPR